MRDEYEFFPTVLNVYMYDQFTYAFIDLTSHGEAPPPDLYERFLAWAGPRTKH